MSSPTGRIFLWSTTALLALQLPLAAQIPNESFENWTDCLPDHWSSPNACGVLTPVTRSATASAGSWALRGEVISFFGQTIAPLIQSGATGEGSPISQRHATLDGSYLFSPVGGDRFAVNVAFYRGETVVAQGAFAAPATVGTYAPFSVTMNYVSADVPDTAIIQVQIVGPVTGVDFHVGSVMHVDGLAFTTGSVAAPALSFQQTANGVVISWPANVTGYTLQSSPTLQPTAWSNVTGAVNNSYLVPPAPPNSVAFFRLFKE